MFPCVMVYTLLFLACSTQASDVLLTSNLTNGNLAYDEQVIVFRCIIRGTILVWKSDEYIGSIADGRDLRLTFVDRDGHTERSSVDGTVARLVSVTTVNGGTVIESELRIKASLATSMSSVTCTNNGGGEMNTTTFRVVSRMVRLTSNLTNGNLAYDGQVIVFRCITRGTILVWQSDSYIGLVADGRDLRLTFVDPAGHTERSPLVGSTVARVISIIEDMDGTLIESELEIRASLTMSNASVTCTNNGLGRMNTTYFRVVEMPSTATTMPATVTENRSPMTSTVDSSSESTSTEESVPDPRSGSSVGVAFGVVLFLIVITVIIAIAAIVFFVKKYTRKGKLKIQTIEQGSGEGGPKGHLFDQGPPVQNNNPTCIPPVQPGSRGYENESEGYPGKLDLPGTPDPKRPRRDCGLIEAEEEVGPDDGHSDDVGAKGSPREGGVLGAQKEEQGLKGPFCLEANPEFPVYESEDGEGGAGPKGGGIRLVEAEEEVGPEGSPQPLVPCGDSGDAGAKRPAGEGGEDRILGLPQCEQRPTILEGQKKEQEIRVSITESGDDTAKIVLLNREYRVPFKQSGTDAEAAYTSLPCKIMSGQSYAEAGAKFNSLPLNTEAGATPEDNFAIDLDDLDSDFDNFVDPFMNSTPLTSLLPDPNGGRFMVSGSINDCILPMNQLHSDPESDKQISEPEDIIEENADIQPEADDEKPESFMHVKVLRT